MVSQVAAFLEYTSTVRVLAFEVELDSLRFGVPHSDRLMPLFGHPFEGLVLGSSWVAYFLKLLHKQFLFVWLIFRLLLFLCDDISALLFRVGAWRRLNFDLAQGGRRLVPGCGPRIGGGFAFYNFLSKTLLAWIFPSGFNYFHFFIRVYLHSNSIALLSLVFFFDGGCPNYLRVTTACGKRVLSGDEDTAWLHWSGEETGRLRGRGASLVGLEGRHSSWSEGRA